MGSGFAGRASDLMDATRGQSAAEEPIDGGKTQRLEKRLVRPISKRRCIGTRSRGHAALEPADLLGQTQA